MTARPARLASVFTLSILGACAGSTKTAGSAASAPTPAAAVAATPKPFEYAASTGQYRFTVDAKGSQSVMGNTRETTSLATRVMTIALSRSAPDTVTMNLTIDSISMSGSMPSLGADKAIGAKFTAKIAPNGVFYSATGPSEAENPIAAGMTDELGRAMPRIKATLTNGAVWTDSINDKVKQGPIEVTRNLVTKYTVLGDSLVGGEPSWKIQREFTVKGTGAGSNMGQAVTFETTGTGKGILLVSKKGVLMGGRGEETSNGTATMTAQGIQIALTNTQTTQFTKIK